MSKLKVWTNGTDTVIAEDMADVRNVYAEMGATPPDSDEDDWWREDAEDDADRELTIQNFDGRDGVVTRTRAEWIASEGRGFLCTTEF